MSLPQLDFTGQVATVTVMELRAGPGDIIDRVARGLTVHITKHGRHVATLSAAPTVIHPDGSWSGAKPLTMGLKLGGEYAN